MGAQAQYLMQSPAYCLNCHSLKPKIFNNNNTQFSINITRCCSSRFRSNWDRNPDPTANERFRFNLEDNLYTDGADFTARQRKWWSDHDYDSLDGDDSDWEFDELDESLIFKIFKVFGWMIPAIGISLLLGTGPNALLMALVPLGQSVLSIVFDKVWGTTSNGPKFRPRTKRKRKPFARAASNTETRKAKQDKEASKGRGSYQSWVVADKGSFEKHDKSGTTFGGWDELDKKVGNHWHRAAGKSSSHVKKEQPKHQKKVKLSRIGRIRETPLLLRLLIAVFPFLGSWTRLLF